MGSIVGDGVLRHLTVPEDYLPRLQHIHLDRLHVDGEGRDAAGLTQMVLSRTSSTSNLDTISRLQSVKVGFMSRNILEETRGLWNDRASALGWFDSVDWRLYYAGSYDG